MLHHVHQLVAYCICLLFGAEWVLRGFCPEKIYVCRGQNDTVRVVRVDRTSKGVLNNELIPAARLHEVAGSGDNYLWDYKWQLSYCHAVFHACFFIISVVVERGAYA